ncbi:hypothetical protein VHEMI00203 [[Torrubiella] hemipterigena]|uniref:N-acetyltransferase domain-containing protein n=1 Tax=[Torrubiella] hemipterigena TaxID=1531966 RepID=A0A0A1T1K1_9HYPO|nr:hypothetical protein VHEMI00203 [[Torrubiella] hemipterigena]
MSISVRLATIDDLEAIVDIDVAAYLDTPFRNAMFPASKSVKPGTEDQKEFLREQIRPAIQSTARRWIVAVDHGAEGLGERVVGCAQWTPPRKRDALTLENADKAKDTDQKSSPNIPAYVDMGAVQAANAEIENLMTNGTSAFQDKDRADMWTLSAIGVDPNHRRKGVGKMLTLWGLDQAVASNQDVWLIATPSGYPLYSSLGLVEVAKGSRCGEPQFLMTKFIKP